MLKSQAKSWIKEQKAPHSGFHWHSTGLPRVAHIRLWGWAKKRATFPGSAWLLKLILHLEKILPLNAYSLWAETDVNPAYRQIPGPGCLLRSAQLLTGKLPSSHVGVWWRSCSEMWWRTFQGRLCTLVGPRMGHWLHVGVSKINSHVYQIGDA